MELKYNNGSIDLPYFGYSSNSFSNKFSDSNSLGFKSLYKQESNSKMIINTFNFPDFNLNSNTIFASPIIENIIPPSDFSSKIAKNPEVFKKLDFSIDNPRDTSINTNIDAEIKSKMLPYSNLESNYDFFKKNNSEISALYQELKNKQICSYS